MRRLLSRLRNILNSLATSAPKIVLHRAEIIYPALNTSLLTNYNYQKWDNNYYGTEKPISTRRPRGKYLTHNRQQPQLKIDNADTTQPDPRVPHARIHT